MSVLLALPQGITMRSPPPAFHADYKFDQQRDDCLSAGQRIKSPRLLHRAVSGRISRGRPIPSLSLSASKQQILWDTLSRRDCRPEQFEPFAEDFQSLQYITPDSFTVSPAPSVAPSSPAISLEPLSAPLNPEVPGSAQLHSEPPLGSFDLMMSTQHYNHVGSYPTNYTPSYVVPYRESSQEDVKPRIASPHQTYAPAYAGATEGATEHSGEDESGERAAGTPYQYTAAPRTQYEASAAPAVAYGYAQTPTSGYAPSYVSAHDHYAHSQYQPSYGQQASTYLPHPTPGYSSPYAAGPVYTTPPGIRPERESRTGRNRDGEYRCYQHGCNGKKFSTLSNLLRHERERGGNVNKAICEKCGAEFTRTTARNSHRDNNKCKHALKPNVS
ncbi:uncharacterized protein PV09_07649 [Verruconis gallopava]|uniref:C2H2-domain containing protein first zinc finger domain-containing protein n=1 Tax=Verruconis gallopava TaxID=253628 RepID=A0A0D1YJ42_9PEZI|nr:uncharacterized protein PV09_07649 [Verruconis gallopava]KIW00902.1 hypothetical protein PV09_07649 [Verruconis gallopava]